MDPLGSAIGQLAMQSMRRQFDYAPQGEHSPTRPARLAGAAHLLKRLVTRRRATGRGPVPVTAEGRR